jgi:hypothetical protein
MFINRLQGRGNDFYNRCRRIDWQESMARRFLNVEANSSQTSRPPEKYQHTISSDYTKYSWGSWENYEMIIRKVMRAGLRCYILPGGLL